MSRDAREQLMREPLTLIFPLMPSRFRSDGPRQLEL